MNVLIFLFLVFVLAYLFWPKFRKATKAFVRGFTENEDTVEYDLDEKPNIETPVYSDFDDIEKQLDESREKENTGKTIHQLHIEYGDALGQCTERDIDVKSVSQFSDGLYIDAFCHLRNEMRTFRSDRILEAIDLDTGEEIEDVELFLLGPPTEDELRKEALKQAVEIKRDIFRILLYIAKADKRYTQKEKAIVRYAIRMIVGDPDISDKDIDREMKKIDIPSYNAFKMAVGRVLKQDWNIVDIEKFAKALVGTKKVPNMVEQEALEYIVARKKKIEKDRIKQ